MPTHPETEPVTKTPFDYKRAVKEAFSHLEKGDALAPPEHRVPRPEDMIIQRIIDELPASTRLYPEVYAWVVADVLPQALSHHYSPVGEGDTGNTAANELRRDLVLIEHARATSAYVSEHIPGSRYKPVIDRLAHALERRISQAETPDLTR